MIKKDKKILEKAIAEDPTIFDYDSQYEEMQKVRDQKIIEQKEADKEKKVKNKNYREEKEDKYERGRGERSNSLKKFKRISDDSKSEKNGGSLPSFIPSIDDEMNEEIRRMEKIRQILRRRNDENAVAEARLRYFERREQGEILPPF
uniref:Uncharacterized protein n=1 Tax=Meloidogyne incognita TaxID=6306 RepID=A0A914MSG5_MELIC